MREIYTIEAHSAFLDGWMGKSYPNDAPHWQQRLWRLGNRSRCDEQRYCVERLKHELGQEAGKKITLIERESNHS